MENLMLQWGAMTELRRVNLQDCFYYIVLEKSSIKITQVYTEIIRVESSKIQKLGKRYNGFTNQQNLLSHLKTQLILITNFEHVLMVKPLIYEILLSCHKLHYIFQASKGFSGSFNKPGQVNGSANNIWLGKRFNQIL